MPTVTAEPGARFRRDDAARWAPWAISLALHLAVSIGAFFVVWTVAPGERERTPVTISFDDPAPAPAPSPAPSQVSSERTPEEPAVAVDLAALLPLPSSRPDDFAAPPLPLPAEIPTPKLTPAAQPEVTFSGLGASNARDIVYVVDASGSMITTWPEAKAELLRSIDALAPTQRFQVLLVSHQGNRAYLAAPIPASAKRPVLIEATRRHKALVADWLNSIAPAGRSNPIAALEAAIAMKPDAVFLLSSRLTGPETQDFDPQELLDRLDRLNPADPRTGLRPIAIKTIHLIETDPLGLMETIGRAHGGGADGHRFISRDEFNTRRLRGAAPGERRP